MLCSRAGDLGRNLPFVSRAVIGSAANWLGDTCPSKFRASRRGAVKLARAGAAVSGNKSASVRTSAPAVAPGLPSHAAATQPDAPIR